MDGIQSFVDRSGRRWRALAEARPLLEETVAPWLDGELDLGDATRTAPTDAPLVALKRSKRRDVFRSARAASWPLLLKKYPARAGLLGRGRDWVGTRAAAELRIALALAAHGIATPRALGCAEPPDAAGTQPSWFVSQFLLGAKPLGTWLEERFQPGDGAPAKSAIARRALLELARVHTAGIWHRDFHGGNVLLHEGEGPAARLYLIDLHSALDLGLVPQRLRARDAADFLHSLRYAFAREEVDALAGEAERFELEPGLLRVALERKREAQARSRGARAFAESSRFAQTEINGRIVSHDRVIDAAAIERLLAGHEGALVRSGRRTRLSRQPLAGGGEVIVKEFLGSAARRKARAAFAHAVAAQARDLAVAAPLACVTSVAGAASPSAGASANGAAFVISRAIEGATPLHLLAQSVSPFAGVIAQRVADLLVTLVQRRFVHPDLSPKNLLVRESGGATELLLVDLDAARPGARWSRRRLLRALAQLGDVPTRTFSTPQRLRFLDAITRRLGLPIGRGPVARATAKLLRERQHLATDGATRGAPRLDLARLPSLHLFGNWKWTGPADPAVALAAALAPDALLLAGHCPFPDLGQPVAAEAAARGVPHQTIATLQKHWNPLRTGRAAAAVLPIARAHAPAVMHVHFDGDQAAAERVARALEAAPAPAIVRHVHAGGPHAARSRRLLRRATLLTAPTVGLARALEAELERPNQDVAVLETSVDLARFRFTDERRARGRERLGLGVSDVAFGIVARIQAHRRWELLLEAWAALKRTLASERRPKLVILGRGTLQDELVRAPAARLGLESIVLQPGYQQGEAYVEALAACDAGIFLVPGSDVSCRAVREWMAMGRAVVATRRPPLPELIEDDVDGRLADEDVGALAATVRELVEGKRLAAAGACALATAKRRFDPAWLRANGRALGRMAALALPGSAAGFRGAADLVAAARPGRLSSVLRLAQREGFDPERVIVFDPGRSRDAVLDLFALVRAAAPKLVLLEPFSEFDATLAAELRRAAPETLLLAEPGRRDAAARSPLARHFGCVEA